MAKNSTIKTESLPKEQGEEKKYGILKVFKTFVFFILVLAVVGVFWKNPQLISKAGGWLDKYVSQPKETDFSDSVSLLKQEIYGLKKELSDLNSADNSVSIMDIEGLENRFESIEKTNLGILEAKADASTVLGIVTRLDKLEEKVDTLARVTDDSALILTAVLMVKDTAERGTIFSYEAEILSQLAQNNVKIKEPIAIIEKTAVEGIKSDVFLVNSFASIYREVSKEQNKEFEKNWKDSVNNKLNEFI